MGTVNLLYTSLFSVLITYPTCIVDVVKWFQSMWFMLYGKALLYWEFNQYKAQRPLTVVGYWVRLDGSVGGKVGKISTYPRLFRVGFCRAKPYGLMKDRFQQLYDLYIESQLAIDLRKRLHTGDSLDHAWHLHEYLFFFSIWISSLTFLVLYHAAVIDKIFLSATYPLFIKFFIYVFV